MAIMCGGDDSSRGSKVGVPLGLSRVHHVDFSLQSIALYTQSEIENISVRVDRPENVRHMSRGGVWYSFSGAARFTLSADWVL